MTIIDMTAQLAPVIWGMVAVLVVSGTAVAASILPYDFAKCGLRRRPTLQVISGHSAS